MDAKQDAIAEVAQRDHRRGVPVRTVLDPVVGVRGFSGCARSRTAPQRMRPDTRSVKFRPKTHIRVPHERMTILDTLQNSLGEPSTHGSNRLTAGYEVMALRIRRAKECVRRIGGGRLGIPLRARHAQCGVSCVTLHMPIFQVTAETPANFP